MPRSAAKNLWWNTTTVVISRSTEVGFKCDCDCVSSRKTSFSLTTQQELLPGASFLATFSVLNPPRLLGGNIFFTLCNWYTVMFFWVCARVVIRTLWSGWKKPFANISGRGGRVTALQFVQVSRENFSFLNCIWGLKASCCKNFTWHIINNFRWCSREIRRKTLNREWKCCGKLTQIAFFF